MLSTVASEISSAPLVTVKTHRLHVYAVFCFTPIVNQ